MSDPLFTVRGLHKSYGERNVLAGLDFEIGRDHGLPEPAVIGLDGLMTGDIPDLLIGLTEDEAADYVIEWLREEGLLEKRESYRHSVGHCERSGTRIQPLVSLQWWCAMEELARPAIEAIAPPDGAGLVSVCSTGGAGGATAVVGDMVIIQFRGSGR